MNQPDRPSEDGSQLAPLSVEGAASVTLGDILRQARERRGLTLDEVAHRTRLPKRHLEALERNSLAGIPSGMYQRAEVRTYADAIGLDPQLALVALGRAQAASTPAVEARPRRPLITPRLAKRRRARRRLLTVALLAGAIGAGTALWWWQASGRVGIQPPAVENTGVPAAPQPDPADTPATVRAADAPVPVPLPVESASAPQVFDYPDLRVITQPAGARVTVDGVGWGHSPVTIRALPSGARLVRVTLDGYAAQERRVAVPRDTPRTTVRITLRPLR